MFIENFVVGLAFVGLLHRWALVMLRDRVAAVITPLLVFLNGGLGWILLLMRAMDEHDSFIEFPRALPASFTVIPETTWRWGNAMSTLLIPQRGFLLGLPLAVIVFTQWWLRRGMTQNTEAKRKEGKQEIRETGKDKSKRKRGRRTCLVVPAFLRCTLSDKRMIAAGIVAGLLPLVHAHSFVVVMVVGAGIALLQRRWRLG